MEQKALCYLENLHLHILQYNATTMNFILAPFGLIQKDKFMPSFGTMQQAYFVTSLSTGANTFFSSSILASSPF